MAHMLRSWKTCKPQHTSFNSQKKYAFRSSVVTSMCAPPTQNHHFFFFFTFSNVSRIWSTFLASIMNGSNGKYRVSKILKLVSWSLTTIEITWFTVDIACVTNQIMNFLWFPSPTIVTQTKENKVGWWLLRWAGDDRRVSLQHQIGSKGAGRSTWFNNQTFVDSFCFKYISSRGIIMCMCQHMRIHLRVHITCTNG